MHDYFSILNLLKFKILLLEKIIGLDNNGCSFIQSFSKVQHALQDYEFMSAHNILLLYTITNNYLNVKK